MEKFTSIKGIAATMLNKSGNQLSLMMNIDTDMIIPKQFLKTIKRSGLGKNLFDEMRYERPCRRVTEIPTGIPSRILKPATDFLAVLIVGCCPVIVAISLTQLSSSFEFFDASPRPRLTDIFTTLGTCEIF